MITVNTASLLPKEALQGGSRLAVFTNLFWRSLYAQLLVQRQL